MLAKQHQHLQLAVVYSVTTPQVADDECWCYNGEVDAEKLGRFIGAQSDQALKRALVLLRKGLASSEHDQLEVSGVHVKPCL